MLRKLVQVLALAVLFVLLPALGNLEALGHAKLWIVLVMGALATIYQPGYSPADRGPEGDRWTMLQIIWSIYATQLAMILEAIYLRYPGSFAWTPLSVAALAVALFGLWLRSWATVVLGELFTMHVRILPEHRVIQHGPYRFVRHPSYTGALLTYLALPVFLGAYYTFALALVLLPFAFYRRIPLEEGELVKALGAPYEDYRKQVGALIPRLRR